MKPQARSEYRGEFRPVATRVPGLAVGEHIPRTAGQAHHLALVRSVSHPDNVVPTMSKTPIVASSPAAATSA